MTVVLDMNPLDYVYRCMACQLQVMTEDDTDAQLLLKYIQNSSTSEFNAHLWRQKETILK